MAAEVIIRPATYDDARALALNMRVADAEEVYASSGHHPYQVLANALEKSPSPAAGLINGKLAALFGLFSYSILGDVGIPWLMTSTVVDYYPVLFYRMSRRIMDDMKADYPVLVQMVDARHTQALGWLQRLGFHKEPAQKYGYAQLPFHRMIWRRYV